MPPSRRYYTHDNPPSYDYQPPDPGAPQARLSDENTRLLFNYRRWEFKQHKLSRGCVALVLLFLLVQIFIAVNYLYPGALDTDPVRRRIRQEWAVEKKVHLTEQAKMVQERRGWDEERCRWEENAREQERKEAGWRAKERELEQRRDALRWGEVRPADRCSSYGIREYTATLVNWPMNYDGRLSCMSSPIEINGVTYDRPDYCEDVGQRGQEIVGHWTIRDDASCVTYWEDFQDKGCVGPESGLRRYQAHMGNLYESDDWRIMCENTPVHLKGQSFAHPHSCANWDRWGIWGIWMVQDRNC